jgi:hypothetical protein
MWRKELAFIKEKEEIQPSISMEAAWNEDAWNECLSKEVQLDTSRPVLKPSRSGASDGCSIINLPQALKERKKALIRGDSYASLVVQVGDDTFLEKFLDEVRNVILVSYSFAIARWDADSIVRLYFPL